MSFTNFPNGVSSFGVPVTGSLPFVLGSTGIGKFIFVDATYGSDGNIRSWIHYIEARANKDAQGEHEELAKQIKEIFVKHFPITAKALEWTL